jgi:tellurite resistance protein TehA-like permease
LVTDASREGEVVMGQAHGLASLFILLTPVLGMIGVFVILNAARNPAATTAASLALYALGFAFFFVAKLSLIRSGRLVTFGSRLMRPGYRALYRLGYALMAAGALFTLGLLVADNLRRAS